ncbi:hypothetical protein JCM11641_001693 [Rhodosporidiobolus odoratus]
MTSPPTAIAPPSELFTIRPTPSGYLGAFSTRHIPRGSLVLADSPLFVLDAPLQAYLFSRMQSGSGGGPTPPEGEEEQELPTTLEEFLDRQIRTMLEWKTEEQRKAFWELANTRPEVPSAYGIFLTNAVQTKDETGGLFPSLSRFNSSCRPTLSRPSWDPSTSTTNLYALRDISPDEELTWTYLNVTFEFEGVEARREEMKKVFEFECGCFGCLGQELGGMGEEERKGSERRLLRLRGLKERIDWSEEGDGERRRETLRKMAELAREEGLWETADRLEKSTQLLEPTEA